MPRLLLSDTCEWLRHCPLLRPSPRRPFFFTAFRFAALLDRPPVAPSRAAIHAWLARISRPGRRIYPIAPNRAHPMNSSQELQDRRIAYALLRVFLGVDITLHGVSRLWAGPAAFQAKTEAQFAHTLLPHAAVSAFTLLLPWAEGIVGLFVLLGAATRLALIGGALLMIVLTFGSSLVQDWSVVGIQLSYAITYALLLFLHSYNGWSVDAWLRRRSHRGP